MTVPYPIINNKKKLQTLELKKGFARKGTSRSKKVFKRG